MILEKSLSPARAGPWMWSSSRGRLARHRRPVGKQTYVSQTYLVRALGVSGSRRTSAAGALRQNGMSMATRWR